MVQKKRAFTSIDDGFLFPFFLLITAPVVYFTWGLVCAYFYSLCISLCHVCFLFYFPYIQDSSYYQYVVMKKKFYSENLRYQHLFSQNIITSSRVLVLFSFYLLFNFPRIYPAIFPVHCIGTVIFMSSAAVDILNIVSRPRLPDKIRGFHPLLQNRYGPVTEIVINKVVPLCANIAGYAATGYLAFAGGFKARNGISEIDPIRNDLLNRYYRFPLTHKWNEMSLSAWSTFRHQTRVNELPYDRQIAIFLERENQFAETVAKAAANLCDMKKD